MNESDKLLQIDDCVCELCGKEVVNEIGNPKHHGHKVHFKCMVEYIRDCKLGVIPKTKVKKLGV